MDRRCRQPRSPLQRSRSEALVPSTATTVLIFLLLVTPGVMFELSWQRSHPRRDESTFVEISRVLLAGVLLSGFAAILLAVLGLVTSGVVIDLGALVRDGHRYVETHLGIVVCDVMSLPLLALLLGVAANDLLTPTSAHPIAQETAWHTAFSRATLTGTQAFVSVQLKDGTTITGYQAGYSLEPDPAKRELLLAAPFTVWRAGTVTPHPLDEAWQRIVLHGTEISSIAVAYVGEPATKRPLRPHQRLARWTSRHAWQTSLGAAGGLLIVLALLRG